MGNRVVTLRGYVVTTGRWNHTGEVGPDGAPLVRPETREIAFGSEVDAATFAPADLESYLAEGLLAPAGSPAAEAAIARARAERDRGQS